MLKNTLCALGVVVIVGCTTTVPVLKAIPMVSCGDVAQELTTTCDPLPTLVLGATYEQALSAYASTKTAYGLCQLRHKELSQYLLQCNKTIQIYNDNLPK